MSLEAFAEHRPLPTSTATRPSSMLTRDESDARGRSQKQHLALPSPPPAPSTPDRDPLQSRIQDLPSRWHWVRLPPASGFAPGLRPCPCLVFSGRRALQLPETVGDPLIVLVEVGELCYLSDPGGNSKLVTGVTLARPGLAYAFKPISF